MITSSTLVKTVTVIGSAVGAFVWVPDAADWTRDFVSEPLRIEIRDIQKEMQGFMASCKHFDIRTDELTEDVRSIQSRIDIKKSYIESNLSGPVLTPQEIKHKLFLEHQLDVDNSELQRKLLMLQRATQEDQALLKQWSQA